MVYVFKDENTNEVLAVVNTECDDMLIHGGYKVSVYNETEPVFIESEDGLISPDNKFIINL